ncbi:A-kinase-interacting protein 1 isoform X1 [Xiphias gladius]|uniref:A-kinase-interacting protein 1 isoform X1 n=1 Tax=Xiphias gladius TaxID=8245 RepID=UPI001A98E8BE|nr:A-kinase-interacting protein 1 isoform X1 [Xiphias gladius]XP_039988589.1 A-kinase-interacting protein 1 isoform X1 [Xiphias gladius]XP_039988590.1 A-kinase-interacting protein 1 isoform X1 [Xiphias gladius]XP_039988591.1 A-kinase-interacting protein 1 isoform X1 [Xiphias gladius]XP_039988594.1 A-kinase-interacting protein 1 isoform X1 [Xiphias gladius]XP_039988595.1 A-kinase-interacting protein 1 isoform X1 [Xiphias gladius]XP_039988596.1 A-kinase-interacting protein 1 isoform X1 [Xiphias
MASQAWLESSLRRSGSLGLEVLERASRRSVDWTSTGASQTPTTTDEDTQIPVKTTHTELSDAFATIAEFMAQTTYQCKRFYESGRCAEPTDSERNHVSRFHTRRAAGKTTPALPTRKRVRMSAEGEDFYIEVSPGTYAITASMPESQQQTQLVSVKAGESINLTFNL